MLVQPKDHSTFPLENRQGQLASLLRSNELSNGENVGVLEARLVQAINQAALGPSPKLVLGPELTKTHSVQGMDLEWVKDYAINTFGYG